MEERTRAYRRNIRRLAILSRRRKITRWYGYTKGYELFPVDGKLAKESFRLSSSKKRTAKTKTHGWKISDLRQILREKDGWDE